MLVGAILHPQRFEKQRERCSGEGLKDKNHTYSGEYARTRSHPPKESSQGSQDVNFVLKWGESGKNRGRDVYI